MDRVGQITLTPEQRTAHLTWCRAFIDHHCIVRSPPGQQLLISRDLGKLGDWMFYLPVAVLNQEFGHRIGLLFWDQYLAAYAQRPFQLCGCESGGITLMCALQAVAYDFGLAVNAFAIKKAAKSYGIKNWLEGVVLKDVPVLVIDDVVGIKKTLSIQCPRLCEFGLELMAAFCIASCKLPTPLTLDVGGRTLNVNTLFGPADFVKPYERYVAKYGKQPRFPGTIR
jgi:hypothetical protein